MEELTGLLEGSFKVSSDFYSTSGVHPRFSQYKTRTYASPDQESRRQSRLEQQQQ